MSDILDATDDLAGMPTAKRERATITGIDSDGTVHLDNGKTFLAFLDHEGPYLHSQGVIIGLEIGQTIWLLV